MPPSSAPSTPDSDNYDLLESGEVAMLYQEPERRETYMHPLPPHCSPLAAPMIANEASVYYASYGTYDEVIPGTNFGPWDVDFWLSDSRYMQHP
jgi:hypothetical protein